MLEANQALYTTGWPYYQQIIHTFQHGINCSALHYTLDSRRCVSLAAIAFTCKAAASLSESCDTAVNTADGCDIASCLVCLTNLRFLAFN